MGFDPVTMAVIGIAGAATSAYGAHESGQAQGKAADYQSQVAANNAAIARENVSMTEAAGSAAEASQGLKTRSAVGNIKAAQGASGLDVNSGSTADVRSAAAKLGSLDALTIRSNTARAAYGYEVASTSDEAESQLLTSEASQARTAGDVSALGTFLSGASSVGGKYANYQNAAGTPSLAKGPLDITFQS